MNNVAKQESLAVWTILPPDFRLEVTQLDDGRIETNKMGLDAFTSNIRMSMSWMNKLNEELGACFWKQFHAEPICLSEYTVDGKMLMRLRSRDKVTLDPLLSTKQPDLALAEGEAPVIDI